MPRWRRRPRNSSTIWPPWAPGSLRPWSGWATWTSSTCPPTRPRPDPLTAPIGLAAVVGFVAMSPGLGLLGPLRHDPEPNAARYPRKLMERLGLVGPPDRQSAAEG